MTLLKIFGFTVITLAVIGFLVPILYHIMEWWGDKIEDWFDA